MNEIKSFEQILVLESLLKALEPKGLTTQLVPSNDGAGLNLLLFKNGENWGDVLINSYSYGRKKGLLEGGYGPFATPNGNQIMGYLTAVEAFEIISKAL